MNNIGNRLRQAGMNILGAIQRFMAGRYGHDRLNVALLVVGLILLSGDLGVALVYMALVLILLFAADTSISIYNCIFNTSDALVVGIDRSIFRMHMLLLVFNNAYHVIMTFLLVFFAYDSAKHQLKKTNLSK